jgi:hypothetical protein
MKKIESKLEDELRLEYDLRSLRVRKLGPGRKSFGDVVRLEPDVADAFPDADAVNQALRFLIRVKKEHQTISHPPSLMPNSACNGLKPLVQFLCINPEFRSRGLAIGCEIIEFHLESARHEGNASLCPTRSDRGAGYDR